MYNTAKSYFLYLKIMLMQTIESESEVWLQRRVTYNNPSIFTFFWRLAMPCYCGTQFFTPSCKNV